MFATSSSSSMQPRSPAGSGFYRGGVTGDETGDHFHYLNSRRQPNIDNNFARSLSRRSGIGATTSSIVRPLPVGPRTHGLEESTSSSSSVRSIPIRFGGVDRASSTTLGGRRISPVISTSSASAPGKPPLPTSAYDRISSTLGSKYASPSSSSYSPSLRGHSGVGGFNRYVRSSSSDRSSAMAPLPPRNNYSHDDQYRSLPSAATSAMINKFELLSRPGSATISSSSSSRRPSITDYHDIVLGRSSSPTSLLNQRNYTNGTSPSMMRNIPIYYDRRGQDEEDRDVLTTLMMSPSASGGIGLGGGVSAQGPMSSPGSLYLSKASAISVPDVPKYASNYSATATAEVNSVGDSNAAPILGRQELLEDDDEQNGHRDSAAAAAALRRKYSPSTYGRLTSQAPTTTTGNSVVGNNSTSNSYFVKNEPKRSSTSSVESSESSRLSSGRSSDGGGGSRITDVGRYIRDDDNNDVKKCGLVGLRNLGNTCFMASVVQCLCNTRPFREYFLQSNSSLSTDLNNNTTSRMKGSLVKTFREVLLEIWSTPKGSYISPDRFKTQIQKFAPRFTGCNQQDAQEFLRYLLQGLHDDINRVQQQTRQQQASVSALLDDDTLPDSQKALDSWKRYLRVDDSKIVDIFVGQLKSELKCTVCGHVSTTFDPFWDLSLPIPQDKRNNITLYDCLEAFTKEEVLDGDEKPMCDPCNTRRRCTKKFSIQKFPSVLVIHLKRFSGERYRSRLSTLVDFPLTKLDLSEYASAKSAITPKYDLYAVSNHSGTPLTGHYTAYCKNSGRWHLFDDTRVVTVNERSVISSEAYVLFYEMAENGSCSRL